MKIVCCFLLITSLFGCKTVNDDKNLWIGVSTVLKHKIEQDRNH